MPRNLPTPKTIAAKIQQAINALDAGRYVAIAEKHVTADIEELGVESVDAYWDSIFVFLQEIENVGACQCYVGGRPPQRSYERSFVGLELFAYAWDSPSAKCRMYLKFGIRDQTYCHLDCHKDRPRC